ncbi:MAG: CRTAC1 family protein [Bacteroidetes bacterium]|nr:CRTAC1 family protein [Bacteroidota bacterium]
MGTCRRHLVLLVLCVSGFLGTPDAVAQSSGPIRFRDVTAGSGMDTGVGASGVSTFDFNQDGLDDITMARRDAAPVLLRNNGDGTFTDMAADAGIISSTNAFVPIWVDVNRDGHPDLFLGASSEGRNALWLNQGNLTFVDAAESWGINPKARVGGAAFGDFSGDGFPDLFLGVRNGPDILYLNRNGTAFEDVSEAYSVQGDPFSIPMQVTWLDIDGDGDQDLFVTHDEQEPNFLYINEEGTALVDRAADWGIRDIGSGNTMGVAWGDPDRDGDLDVYVTRIGVAGFYRFNAKFGRFYDEATPWRVAQNGTGWGTYFADFDNDGDEDLAAVHSATAGFQPPVVFVNQEFRFDPLLEAGDFRFVLSDLGLSVADFNQDGRLDLVTANSRGEHRILLNETETAGNWLTVELRSDEASPAGIGSRLELDVGDHTLVRILHAGDGYLSQNTYRVHFGLGHHTSAQALRIRGSDGSWQSFGPLGSGIRHVVRDGVIVTDSESVAPSIPSSVLEIWPNPADDRFQVSAHLEDSGPARWSLTDTLGRVWMQGHMRGQDGPRQVTVETGGLPAGVYWFVAAARGAVAGGPVIVP